MTEDEIAMLESQMFGLPHFADVAFNITMEDIEIISIMMNHVTIQPEGIPKMFLHSDELIPLARSYVHECASIDEAIAVLNENTSNIFECSCRAHLKLDELEPKFDSDSYDLYMLLCSLQRLDFRSDQSGVQCIVTLFNYACRKARIHQGFFAKSESLQVSCVTYDTSTNRVTQYNATPDFGAHGKPESFVAVGEVQSSPYVQMLVAGLGHLSNPCVRYLLGIVVSKQRLVHLYLLENEQGTKTHSNQVYTGPIILKSITVQEYRLNEAESLCTLLKKVMSVMNFIIKEYDERMKVMVKPQLPPDTIRERRSERLSRKRPAVS